MKRIITITLLVLFAALMFGLCGCVTTHEVDVPFYHTPQPEPLY